MSLSLQDYTTLVCVKVGQTDPASVAACRAYLQQRCGMIYDRAFWRDARIQIVAQATANQSYVLLPDGVDRVESIRYGDHFLDPVDATFLVQANPSIFEQNGVPRYYEEWTDESDDTKKIKLYPTPAIDGNLLIVGKRTMPPLVQDADKPILRNIDNCLIAYATGDMLERQRQYGKAQAKFDEGAKLYTELLALEQQQTNVPRRTKALTVAGNSLAEMTDEVAARCGDWSPSTRILIQQFLRRNYQMVYDSALWPESLVLVNARSDGAQVVLPEYVGRVVAVRSNTNTWGQIENADLSLYFNLTPQIFEQSTGPAVGYSLLTPVGVAILPPQRERLSIVSTSDADAGNVFVKGESAGIEVNETIALNGTTPVLTANPYDVPLTVSKLSSVGDVIVHGSTSSVQLQRILAAETERKHIRLWLQPNGSSDTCLVLGKRRIHPLAQDEDTPILSDIQNALIFATLADCLSKAGNAAGATDARTQGAAALKALLDLTTQQSAIAPRVIPYVEPSYCTLGYSEDWFLP